MCQTSAHPSIHLNLALLQESFFSQGHSQPYKTVNAKALEDSQVIKLPMRAFQEVFKEYPDIFVRVIQVRLRITLSFFLLIYTGNLGKPGICIMYTIPKKFIEFLAYFGNV